MNKGEIVGECLDRLGAGRQSNTRLTTKIAAQINAAYRTLCGMQPWQWLAIRTTIDFTDDDEYIALPTTTHGGETVQLIGRVQAVALSDLGKVLQPMSEQFRMVAAGRPTGWGPGNVPNYWCVAPGADGRTPSLLLLPQPGYSDTAIVWGLRSFASIKLVDDSDEPVFAEEFHGYLVEKPMSALASMDATMDRQVAIAAQQEANRIYRAMMFQHRQMQPIFQHLRWPGHGLF